MSTIAIIGAGPAGGALAQCLAARGRVREVRLIDSEGRIAEGKALDIMQSAPIEAFSTRVSGAAAITAAAGADAIVLADLAASGEIAGESGLSMVRQLLRFEEDAPLVFACGGQRDLMQRALEELHAAARRLVGSAPLALESAVRAVAAARLDASPGDVSIGIAGVPPRDAVIGWEAATAFNQPISAVLAPHHIAALSSALATLWPPGPYALASAAARVSEALASGSRRRFTCFAATGAPGAGRSFVAAVPIEIEKGGIRATLAPALSRHERTIFENGLRG